MDIKASLLIHAHADIVLTLSALEAYGTGNQPDQSPNQAGILRDKLLRQIEENASDRANTYRSLAINKLPEEGHLEIDEGAPVSLSDDDGAYVQGWIWVPNPNGPS